MHATAGQKMENIQSGLTWGVCFFRICLPIGSGHKIFGDKTLDKKGELLLIAITQPQASAQQNGPGGHQASPALYHQKI